MSSQEMYEKIKKDYKLEKYDTSKLYKHMSESIHMPGIFALVDKPEDYISVQHVIVNLKTGSHIFNDPADFFILNSIDVSPETKSKLINYQKLCLENYINIVNDYIPKDLSNIVGEYLIEPLCKIKLFIFPETIIFEEDIYKFPTFFKEPILLPKFLTVFSDYRIGIYNKLSDELNYEVTQTNVWLQHNIYREMRSELGNPLKITDKLITLNGMLQISR